MVTPLDKLIRLNADIPDSLHFEFKKACLNNQESMTEVLTRLIQNYITRSNKK